MKNAGFRAGAGCAGIAFTKEMLPNFGENYTDIHDLPSVQAVVLEAGERVALVSLCLVNASENARIRRALAELFRVPERNVLVQAKHALSTPHMGDRDSSWTYPEDILKKAQSRGLELSPEEAKAYADRENRMRDAVYAAALEAGRAALESLQEAELSFAAGYTETNVNRLVRTARGWWQGMNPGGPADRSLPVLRINGTEGRPLALLYSVNCAPGVLENSYFPDGSRWISSDIAGFSEIFIRKQFGEGCVPVYLIGASGDQWTSLRARLDHIDADGTQHVEDLGEAGFELVKILGTRLGEQVVKIAEGFGAKKPESPGHSKAPEASPSIGLRLEYFSCSCPAQRVTVSESSGPSTDCRYIPDGETEAGFAILTVGELAVLFVNVELCAESWLRIKEASPFPMMMAAEFTSGLAGGGYMPTEEFYEKMTYQSRKSRYARGSAGILEQSIIKALRELR